MQKVSHNENKQTNITEFILFRLLFKIYEFAFTFSFHNHIISMFMIKLGKFNSSN